MSLIGRAAKELRSFTQFNIDNNFFGDWGQATSTYAGLTVSQTTAMTISAVYAAVSLISETIATLPVDLVQRYGDGSRYSRPKPAWMLQPNPVIGLDWIGLTQQMLTSLLLDGNAYVGIVRMSDGLTPATLWPLDPTAVTVDQDSTTGEPLYSVATSTGQVRDVARREMLHIRGLTRPGSVTGISPVEQARQSLGRTMAAEKFASAYFANGAIPGTLITAPGIKDDETAERVANRFDKRHGGLDRAFKTVVFSTGTEVKTLNLTPEQVQMLETMRYGVLDVARWYRIAPYLLDPTVSSTWGTGIAEQNTQMKQYTLGPWAARLQSGIAPLVYDTFLNDQYTVRFDFGGFLKGDPEKRAQYLETKMRNRAMTPDEWRALDDENPLPNDLGKNPLNSVQFEWTEVKEGSPEGGQTDA